MPSCCSWVSRAKRRGGDKEVAASICREIEQLARCHCWHPRLGWGLGLCLQSLALADWSTFPVTTAGVKIMPLGLWDEAAPDFR